MDAGTDALPSRQHTDGSGERPSSTANPTVHSAAQPAVQRCSTAGVWTGGWNDFNYYGLDLLSIPSYEVWVNTII